jgi:putative DNA primase/helicase
MNDGQMSFDDFLGPADEPEGAADALHSYVSDEQAEPLDLSKPYAAVAEAMWRAGWHGVLPLPRGKKHAPPAGWTGRGAPYLSFPDLFSLVDTEGAAGANICVRVPETVVGIDVDHYGSKRGGDTLAALEARWGALPATWRSTSRGRENPGGIRFYRVPAGLHFVGGFEAIEIIQEGHRYAVVWPSTNPDAGGARYQWFGPDGEPVDGFPKVDELPELPAVWIDNISLASARVEATALLPAEVDAWLAELRAGTMCGKMRNAVRGYVEQITKPRGTQSRHDLAMVATRAVIAFGGEGHSLGDDQQRKVTARYPSDSRIWRIDAVRDLGRAFVTAVTAPGQRLAGDAQSAVREFESLVIGAVRVAATKNKLPETHDPECFDFPDEVPPWVGPVVGAPRPKPDEFDTTSRWAGVAAPPATTSGDASTERKTGHPAGEATGGAEDKGTAPAPTPAAPLEVGRGMNGKPGPDPDLSGFDTYTSTAKPFEPKVERPIDAAFTDARLAERVAVEVMQGRFCWTGQLGWLRWTGKVWKECEQAAAAEAVREHFLDWFSREVKAGADGPKRKALGGLLSAGRIASITTLTRGLIMREAADFDADPHLLNCRNGVVDLRTGRLMPHDPARSMRKVTSVSYEQGKTHPDFTAALGCLPAEVAEWYQVRLGQAITGFMTSDDSLIVAQGGGENGKTTLHGTLGAVLGGYYVLVSDRVLMASPDAHPTELMDLMGARFAVVEETPEARHLSVARLKKVVGTTEITARRIRQDSVTFKATHSLFLSTNYRPIVAETDRGTWRRLLLVHFPYTFGKALEAIADGERLPRLDPGRHKHGDPTLRERLLASVRRDGPAARAALAWLVEGAGAWYSSGMVMPDAPARVVADTQAWRAESDQVLRYITDRLEFDERSAVLATDLVADFNAWLGDGKKPWGAELTASRFSDHEEFSSREVVKKKVRTNTFSISRTRLASTPWLVEAATVGYAKDVPAATQCWLGVKFRESDEDQLDGTA